MDLRIVKWYQVAVLVLCGCADALDWREIQPAGSHLSIMMPCRPANHTRKLSLSGQTVQMTLHACSAGVRTFSLGSFRVDDPTRVDGALQALRLAAVSNVRGVVINDLPAIVSGMTPNPAARRLAILGRLPDGRTVTEHALLFAHGTQIYQAILLDEGMDKAAADVFFDALKVVP